MSLKESPYTQYLRDHSDCPWLPHEHQEGVCDRCGTRLTGRQTRWCSDKCQIEWRREHDWTAARNAAVRRDDHTCRHCGASAPEAKMTVDHVIPVALGGSNDPTNLVTACSDCNAGKSSSTANSQVVEDVDMKAAQWAKAMEIVAHGRRVEREERLMTLDFLESHWQYSSETYQDLPLDWESSVFQFIAAGLDVEDLTELMSIALEMRTVTNKWRYFCGCCWGRIRESQDQAQRIVSRWEAEA